MEKLINEKLGDILARNISEQEFNRLSKERARVEQMEKNRAEERARIQRFLEDLRKKISNHIMAGKDPSVKVTKDYLCRWIENSWNQQHAPKSGTRHDHYDLWEQFVSEMLAENLVVRVLEAHDGVGIKSWKEITVSPHPSLLPAGRD